MNIKNNNQKIEIDVKRFYLPCDIEYKCPKCGKEKVYDQYVSYPKTNEPEEIDFYCYECEHEWSEKIVIKVSVEKVDEK